MKKYLGSFLLFICCVSNASAGLILDAGPASVTQSFRSGDYSAGTEFTIASALTIDGLAYIDIGSDGLTEDHLVGLWDSAGSLVAQALVTNSSTILPSQSSLARWYVTQISEVILQAGTYRVAGYLGEEPDSLSNDKVSIDGVTLTSGYVRTVFPGGGFNYPDLTFESQAIRASLTTGVFDDVEEEVPGVSEPSLLGMLGIAFLMMRRLRKS